MITSLLNRDRLVWSVVAALYFILGAAILILAGPLTWDIRAVSDTGAVSAAVQVGSVSGFSLVGGLLAVLSTRRPESPVIPLAVPLAGLAAAGAGMMAFNPNWYGLLPLIPAVLSVVGLAARRQANQYRELINNEDSADRPSSVDPSRLVQGEEPDTFLVGGGSVLLLAVGVVGSVISTTILPWMHPDLPDELQSAGQVVVGEGNPVEVELTYGVNYPNSAVLLGDDDQVLAGLVDEGVVELTLQGVVADRDEAQGAPVRAAEACAWDQGGAEATFEFNTNYYQALADEGAGISDASELITTASADAGEDFTNCVDSGKYDLPATRALSGTNQIAAEGTPQITVNGEKVAPVDMEELEQLIRNEM